MSRPTLKILALILAALGGCADAEEKEALGPEPQVLAAVFDWRDIQSRIDAKYAALTPDVRAGLGAPQRGAQPCEWPLLRDGFDACGYQQFASGRIYYHGSYVKEPRVIYGAIYERWNRDNLRKAGTSEGYYGLPVTDELGTPDGRGRYNHFTDGHSIYWTPEYGAIRVYNWAHREWSASGWERGPYGYPTAEAYHEEGGRCGPSPGYSFQTQNFENGYYCGELFRGWLVPWPR